MLDWTNKIFGMKACKYKFIESFTFTFLVKPSHPVIPACRQAIKIHIAFWQAGVFLAGIHTKN